MVGTYSESSCSIKILQMEFRIESKILTTNKHFGLIDWFKW